MKKRLFLLLLTLLCLLAGCAPSPAGAQVAATTLPVYEFTTRLCQGTSITVTRLITENVSCLHDYTLQVSQLRTVENADAVVLSGGGLEDFLADILGDVPHVIDASRGISLLEGAEHDSEADPHIWLSPENAKKMAKTICQGLVGLYPEYGDIFQSNLTRLEEDLDALAQYGEDTLQNLRCRELITFHDGFSYFAGAFRLTILRAVEEESGSEAAASELIELSEIVRSHNLPAIFTEKNGSTAAASVIASETGAGIYTLDMAMAGDSYFTAMYRNIDTIKEALG